VYSASSSKASAHSLPQKRRTLSRGFSQYQQEPFGGNDCLVRGAATCAGNALSVVGLSCVGSTMFPFRDPDPSIVHLAAAAMSNINAADNCGQSFVCLNK
jgi:hypothetical protein